MVNFPDENIDLENSSFDVRGRILLGKQVKVHLESGEFLLVRRAGEIPLGEQAGELMERPPSHLGVPPGSVRVEAPR